VTATAWQAVIDSPFGRLAIRIREDRVAGIDWVGADTPLEPPVDPVAREAVAQLRAWCADPAFRFDLPLAPAATPFQARVRVALCAIPPGEMRSYGDLARALGSSARAVGGACRRNPVPLVVPCHRVVARHGLGGFGGAVEGEPLALKQRLLDHERAAGVPTR